MSRAGLGLALVWCCSAAALFLPHVPGGEFSPLALALCPWLVWASLPRAGSEPAQVDGLAPWLAAPLVVLGLGLERARGHAFGPALAAGAGLVLLAALYFLAARRLGRSKLGRRIYAGVWFAFVAGAPLLARALESGGAPLFGRAPRALELAAQLSPLSFWMAQLRAPLPGAGLELPWIALGFGAALWLAGRACEARS